MVLLKKQKSPLKTKPGKTTGLTFCHITSKAISQVVTQIENVAEIIFTVIKNKNKQKQKQKKEKKKVCSHKRSLS